MLHPGEKTDGERVAELERENQRLHAFVLELANRIEICSRLLSRCAERKPPNPKIVAVHEAIRRMMTYEDSTMTLAGCRDSLAEVLHVGQ